VGDTKIKNKGGFHMTKSMRKIGSQLLACLLTMLLLCGSAASAEGLLEAEMDIALREGRTIEGTLRIEADGLLSVLAAGAEDPAATLAAASDLLNSSLLRARYTQAGEQRVISAALELRGETLLSLDVRMLNGEIVLESSLLPGKTLVMPAELVTQAIIAQAPSVQDDEWMAALASALARYGAVAGSWAMQSEGIFNALEQPIPVTQTRDAVARSVVLRVTEAQWQDLLQGLAAEFVKDDALQQMLASQMNGVEPDALAALAQQWAGSLGAPQDGAVQVTAYLGEENQIVGVDARIEPAASSLADASKPLQGSFAYGHRSIDADHAADSYEGSFTWGDGSELQAQFYRQDKVPNQVLPAQGEKYGGRATIRTPDTGALTLEAQGDIRRTVEPINEAYAHTFDVRLSQKAEGLDAEALGQLLQAPLLEAGFALNSQTEAIGTEDFRSQGSFTLKLMGQEAAIHYTLASSAYTPAEHPENTVLRLDALAPEELDAITRELGENAQKMLNGMQSSSEKPPALYAYEVDDESVPSIDSVVGFREITNSGAGITEGKPYVQVFYKTSSLQADLQAYVNFLIDNGWVVTRMEGDASGGTFQLASESSETGKLLMVTIEFTADSYSILMHKTSATLRRYTDDAGNKLGEITYTD
jgi:hypothetical protein